jgi:alkanesulfonate monooxygenase SsuD/methylene tetrahydromethanopterin reductase-like flavin-dependent oxidoreductase (luciferase family)
MTRPFILSVSISGTAFDDPARADALLKQAEAAGVDILVLGRVDDLPFDPLVLAAWAAPRTECIGLIATVPAALSHPFHVARALSAIDFLCAGRSGWSPVAGGAPPKTPAGMAEDMVGAARSLWDGWDADTLIIDKASGRYLDTTKVRDSNYDGPFFKVRGPVNAMRPPQGHPLLVIDAAAGLALDAADIALVADGESRPAASRYLVKASPTADPAHLSGQFAAGAIDGVHFALDDPEAGIFAIAERFAPLAGGRSTDGTLRDRLGLPLAAQPTREGAMA